MTATNYVSASSQRQTSSYFIINENPGYVEATLSSSFDVISVSRNIYGEGIKPYSFQLNLSGSIITDDGIGNLNTSGLHIGNILYSQGLAIFTSGSVTYPLTASFQSSYTIYENNIICTVKDSEYNLTYNPSLLSSSMTLTSSVKDFATGSTFVPYVTTVGIYNDANELLMVAKLATPMPISKDTDMSFIIKYDT